MKEEYKNKEKQKKGKLGKEERTEEYDNRRKSMKRELDEGEGIRGE